MAKTSDKTPAPFDPDRELAEAKAEAERAQARVKAAREAQKAAAPKAGILIKVTEAERDAFMAACEAAGRSGQSVGREVIVTWTQAQPAPKPKA